MKFRSAVAGSPVIVDLTGCNAPITVAVFPGAGSTMAVAYSVAVADTAHGAINWIPWDTGDTTTAKKEVLLGPVAAVRFTRVAGSSACSAELFSNG